MEFAGRAVFIAHWRAAMAEKEAVSSLRSARIWTSGVASWFQLAQKGLWVEGCAEQLGFDYLAPMLQEPLFGLPTLDSWIVLTHEAGFEGWKSGRTLATYRLLPPKAEEADTAEAIAALKEATHIYWSSGSQYDRYSASAPTGAVHACGAGKTAAHLRERGGDPLVFPSIEEWRKWLRT